MLIPPPLPTWRRTEAQRLPTVPGWIHCLVVELHLQLNPPGPMLWLGADGHRKGFSRVAESEVCDAGVKDG